MLDVYREQFETAWQSFIPTFYNKDSVLHQACRYALVGSGKRLRPILALMSCEILGGSNKDVLPACYALEMIHTYSLVHDDLPCLDNDDLRRGRPTVHKKFDEPFALLVGDALLTDAFSVLAESPVAAEQRMLMVAELALAAGGRGMVLGQSLDVFWTNREGLLLDHVTQIHLGKTAQLTGAACALGALSGQATEETAKVFHRIGENLGIAFQLIDDLLDDQEGTGKTKGKDAMQKKPTSLQVLSRQEVQKLADQKTQALIADLSAFGEKAGNMIDLCRVLLSRQI